MQHDKAVFVCFHPNMMGQTTFVHQLNTSQCADDPVPQHDEERYDHTGLEDLVQTTNEEFKYLQVAMLCGPMDGSGTIRVSRCWSTVLFQGEEFHNV